MPGVAIPIIATGLAAGGTAATGGALGIGGTAPSRSDGAVGGSREEQERLRRQAIAMREASLAQQQQAHQQLGGVSRQADAMTQNGVGVQQIGESLLGRGTNSAFRQAGQLSQFQSSAPELGSMVGQQAIDRAARSNLGMAASATGNRALATREALIANSLSGADAAQQAQITAGQQQMQADAQRLGALQAAGQLNLGAGQLGAGQIAAGLGAQQFGIGTQQGIGNTMLQAALGREETALGQQQTQALAVQQAQLAIAMEKARAQQQKRDRLFGLAGSLFQGAAGTVGAGSR